MEICIKFIPLLSRSSAIVARLLPLINQGPIQSLAMEQILVGPFSDPYPI